MRTQLGLQNTIKEIQATSDLMAISGTKKLKSNKKGAGKYYRIRLGDYRIGIELLGDTVRLITIGDRKEIYRNFP
jgi:mRNA interferase RelE/StbE